jgi:hypothetical protein
MVFSRALLPTSAVTDGWTTLSEAMRWAGVDPAVQAAYCTQLGDPALDEVQIIAALPPQVLRVALAATVVGGVGLYPVQMATLNLALNAILTKFHLEPTDLLSVEVAPPPPASVGTAVAALGSGMKLKAQQIIDQGLDVEVHMLDPARLAQLRKQYLIIEGDAPIEMEEVTDAQLSCLWAKLEMHGPPFVDMGVWGPYGERIARAMKFTAQIFKNGVWSATELAGAASLDKWEEAWRIFRTAMIMVNAASPAVLDRYCTEFKQRGLRAP